MRISPLLKQSNIALALLTLALLSTAAQVSGQFAVSKIPASQYCSNSERNPPHGHGGWGKTSGYV